MMQVRIEEALLLQGVDFPKQYTNCNLFTVRGFL